MTDKIAKILRDQYLLQYSTYEDYLDSFITPRDLFHLRSKSISRSIIELGYHTPGTLERDDFYKRSQRVARYLYLLQNPLALCSENIEPEDSLLQALALRENANRIGELYTIIFMRFVGKSQSQISGYIDYCHRLKTEDWKPFFENSKKIMPRKSDLSYFDWKSGHSITNVSPNFIPMIDGENGAVFQCVHDGEIIYVDPNLTFESDVNRVIIHSDVYGRVVFYDHVIAFDESMNG